VISFEANITVGIRGSALTGLSAKLSPESGKKWNTDYTPRSVLLECIDSIGYEEWFEYDIVNRVDEKMDAGNYKVTGDAWWDGCEDPDFEYQNIKAIKLI
jgi:uncharacterized protein RhaS with RHS repeats